MITACGFFARIDARKRSFLLARVPIAFPAAVALASVSGYFSILGLAAIFAAAFWPPMSDQNGANPLR